MVHSHYSFVIRQVRLRLFLIRIPGHLKKIRKNHDEFLEEISKLKSVPEIVFRIDDQVKLLREENRDLDKANDERIRQRSIRNAERRRHIEAIEKLKETLLRQKKNEDQ
ncbi:uncharacterized protein LOC111831389 [Capsella rubella]|uniref:uncharacterized protein LOC111831389 n=1 Tax=Capsella rubella TaxID=81985 RepID=UPI000CD4B252|nr:uncharacterized protein LOC111831389 [Capsella rubella]